MYENYTKQSLPTEEYRLLAGTCLCVFALNSGFIIENILESPEVEKDWYELTDMTSGSLIPELKKRLKAENKELSDEILDVLSDLVERRNRIIHSFRITNCMDEQVLATKTKISKGNKQFEITEEYMFEFIHLNDHLSDLLHRLRGF
ncbi:selenium binding protein [Faecalibaculum rodentium]|uniref:selenium binding protein n=2 Tax=Faecalibaculum rodentium TaxID=1702221 RepID=UPI0026704A15|nr:selenium binding protein [Faecalibaculum rodentium]